MTAWYEAYGIVKPYYADDAVCIVHGDCREILPLIPPKSIDLVLTDIPYGISQESNGLRRLDYGDWDNNVDLTGIIKTLLLVLPASYYIWCGQEQLSALLQVLASRGYMTRTLAWCKRNPPVLNGSRLWLQSLELCAFGKLAGAYFTGGCQVSYWLDSPDIARQHPSQKPVAMIARQVQASTAIGQSVLDPFLGSGTTAAAAKTLGRKCIGIEIEEKYCEIAAKRCAQSVMRLESPEPERPPQGGLL